MTETAYIIMVNDCPVETVLGDEESAQTRREELRISDIQATKRQHGAAFSIEEYNTSRYWRERAIPLTIYHTALSYQIDAIRCAEDQILEILNDLRRATGLQVTDVDLRYPNHPRPECPEILGVRISCELEFDR